MKTNIRLIPALLLAGILFFTGCEKDEDPVLPAEKNLVEVAQGAGQFSTLIEAAQKAGLAEFLATENNITVFAPTNAAFEVLLADLGASSLDDIPVADLKQILTYHVIGSKAMSTDLSTEYYPTLASYSGNNISMYINIDNGVAINKNAMVTEADIEAENGVIHVVDKVILRPTVVDIALANENFTILVQAVVKAGLVETLSGGGPFTVFAPTNAAFEVLFTQLEISSVDDLTAEQLIPILTYHVVSGNVLSSDLIAGSVPTLNAGSSLTVDLSSGVKINESQVAAADIQAANGVVHVIDKVLIP